MRRDRPYPRRYYLAEIDPASRSAKKVVPVLVRTFQPASVVDVGCGLGHWLAAFRELGVDDVVGLDAEFVPRERLTIPDSCFVVAELEQARPLPRRFELAICLEVAEHLPATSADPLVDALTRMSDVVVFSAAVPGQGGNHHINEQWQSYWAGLFAARGYLPFDLVRRSCWSDVDVEPYYLQNCLVYVAPAGRREGLHQVPEGLLDVVHPRLFLSKAHADHMSPRALIRALPRAVGQTLRRRRAGYRARLLPR